MSWKHVLGHDRQVQAFREAYRKGRLAHAYLFAGPAGVGKRLFAKELAKALLCEAPPGPLEACDECPGCVQVEAATHPDFFTAARPEDKQEFPIDGVRELCQSFGLKPARGHGKVAIVDDADDLSEEAANAFLKTLEEPPPRSVLILLGTSPELQLPTIVSRCQVIRFPPLPEATVVQVLRQAGQEKDVERLAKLSAGSPGQALALADAALWDFRKKFLLELARPKANPVALAQKWGQFVEEAGKESAAQRRRAALTLRFLIDFYDDAVRSSVGGPTSESEPEVLKAIQDLGQRIDCEKLMNLLDRCLEADRQIDRRVQLVLILESLVDVLAA